MNKEETVKLTEEEIVRAIDELKKTPSSVYTNFGLILPLTKKVLSSRYSGNGRPRNTDYNYVEVDWYEDIGTVGKM